MFQYNLMLHLINIVLSTFLFDAQTQQLYYLCAEQEQGGVKQ